MTTIEIGKRKLIVDEAGCDIEISGDEIRIKPTAPPNTGITGTSYLFTAGWLRVDDGSYS